VKGLAPVGGLSYYLVVAFALFWGSAASYCSRSLRCASK